MWIEFIKKKYIAHDSLEDWIQNPIKIRENISMIWKAMISSFHVIRDRMIQKVGNGKKLWLGTDPYLGSGNSHIMLEHIIFHLREMGFFCLHQVVDPRSTTIWNQGLVSVRFLGLEGEDVIR